MPFCSTRAPRRSVALARRVALPLVLSLVATGALAAQDPACTSRRPRVEGLRIDGNRSIEDVELTAILFTERAGRLRRWFGWNVGPAACLDSVEVRRDTLRIARWYAMRGYPGTTASVELEAKGARTTNVRFRVREAPPIVIDSVVVDSMPPGVAALRAFERAVRGAPLDDSLLQRQTDSLQLLMRQSGYARAAPARVQHLYVDSTARRAGVRLLFRPGPLVHVGRIDVTIVARDSTAAALEEPEVRDLLKLKPGDPYLARSVGQSQQLLYSYNLYRTVAIDTLPLGRAPDSLLMRVRLVEGPTRSLRGGGGWGTLDCFRTQTRFVEQNFLGHAHRLQLDARLSKIGVGVPLDAFPGLCAPGVRADEFSQKLNYYLGASAQWRGVLGEAWHPQLTLFSERRTEFQSYVRETSLGVLASLERPIIPRVNNTFTYRFDGGRTTSDAAVACATFGLCRFSDRAFLLSPSQMHAAGVTLSRSAPALGTPAVNDERWAVETRLGTLAVGEPSSRVNFNRTQVEYALYRPLNRHVIGAARLSAGAVFTKRALEPLVPPQERFYAGGQNTVRGYGQNQLGPAVYIVNRITSTATVDTFTVGIADPDSGYQRLAPAGGTAMALANLELRTRVGWPANVLQWVLFVDAGRVWNNTGSYSVSGLRVTPGFGVRLVTALGPFRVDVGYNPYARESGPAYLVRQADRTLGIPGRAICVSPGTVEPYNDADIGPTAGAYACPTTFRPPLRRGIFPRLAFHFSIGEAF
ncbi:MAG: BamA/TamA family outer membrane protein [Gemmatimonadota bacterium]|nr:BamA/TamA family outer membrane protein [Gemmatimonadota bacterium]